MDTNTLTLANVLVVDDDPDHLNLIARALQNHGFTCHTASNGPDALKLMASLPSSCVVVCDNEMPAMTGLETLQRARRLVRAPLEFVLISGDADADLRRRAGEIGVQTVLEKPLNIKMLAELVRLKSLT